VLVDVVLVVASVVVVVGSQVHVPEQTSPGGQLKAPPGELASHSSPGSRTPLPHVPGCVVVVVEVVVVVDGAPLHSVGYDVNSGTVRRSMQSTLNSVTQSTQSTMSCRSTMGPAQLGPDDPHHEALRCRFSSVV